MSAQVSPSTVISADSHIQEPDEIYADRLDKAFREKAPRVVTNADGSTYRIIDGKRPRRMDVAASRETEDDQNREFRSDPSGGRDLSRRVADQGRDGNDRIHLDTAGLKVGEHPDGQQKEKAEPHIQVALADPRGRFFELDNPLQVFIDRRFLATSARAFR